MAKWAADYAVAAEISQPVINLVLDRFLDVLRAGNLHKYAGQIGRVGSFSAELDDVAITDIEDVPPVGDGVVTDLQLEASFNLRLFFFIRANTNMVFRLEDIAIDLSATPAGLPRGVVLSVTPTLSVKINFPKARCLAGWVLNKVVGPLVAMGVWLAFRIIRKVEIPIWEIVDVFGALGLRFAPGSPLLTAQKSVPLPSLIIASDFNLTNPLLGKSNQMGHFIPANTNIGAVVHERVLTAAVQTAFMKGWVPSRFRVGKWRIYINSIEVKFEKDKIVASGSLRAKRGKCWCRVKARIQFSAAVEPRVIDVNPPNPTPKVAFNYDANINTQISTSGMLVVLGVIMFAPVFLALTTSMSFLINIVLQKFLPFQTSWNSQGLQLTIKASSVNFSGFVPLSMTFPLQLSGQGTYTLDKFQQFQLPGGAQLQVEYTPESLTVQQDELRVAVKIK